MKDWDDNAADPKADAYNRAGNREAAREIRRKESRREAEIEFRRAYPEMTDTEIAERIANRCPDSPTGKHEPDHLSVAPVTDLDRQFIVDVTCKWCGRSGSVSIVSTDIQW